MTRNAIAAKASESRWGKVLGWILAILFIAMSFFGFYNTTTWLLYTHSAQARVVDYRGPFGPGGADGGFTYDLYLQLFDATGNEASTRIFNYSPPLLQSAPESEASFARGTVIDIYLNPKMSPDVLLQNPREHVMLTLGASVIGVLLGVFFFRFGPRMRWSE